MLPSVDGITVNTVHGNQRSIERIPLYRHVECLMKVHRSEKPVLPQTYKMAG